MSATITIESLKFSHPKRTILEDISFGVNAGECMAVLGTNGTGKSTLLKCLNRIWEPEKGEVRIDDVNINDYTRKELAQKIVYVAQSNDCSRATVFDTILLGRKPYIKWDVTQKDLDIVVDVMKQLDLEDYALRYTDELSGGELQKVLIGRALAQQPKVLMLDEPTSSLDLKNQIEVLKIVRHIVEEHNMAAIVTMHDMNQALRFADKFLFLKGGYVYAEGGKEILTKKNLEEVYSVPIDIYEHNGMPVIMPEYVL